MKKFECIAGISSESTRQLLSVFRSEISISDVVLYGSRAKGNFRPGSDIDLTIKGDDLTTTWLMQLSMQLDDLLLPYEIDLSIYSHIENEDLIEHIDRVGKIIFSR